METFLYIEGSERNKSVLYIIIREWWYDNLHVIYTHVQLRDQQIIVTALFLIQYLARLE